MPAALYILCRGTEVCHTLICLYRPTERAYIYAYIMAAGVVKETFKFGVEIYI